MAAFTGTPFDTTHLDNQEASSRDILSTHSPSGLRIVHFPTYTHASAQGTGTGVVRMGMLPPGQLLIYPYLSRVITTQFAANADLHIGYAAHVSTAGATVSADDNAWGDNLDAGGAALDQALSGAPAVLDSISGVVVECMIDTGNIEATDTITLVIAYAQV